MTDTLMSGAQETTESTASVSTEGTTEANQQTASTAPAEQQQTESQTEADKAEGEGVEAEPTDPKGAPEAYEDFTVEEGAVPDPATVDSFKALAKDLNLSQENAQKVYDLGVAMSKQWAEQQTAVLQQAKTEWADLTKSDTEIGGDKFDANLAVAKRGIEQFGTPELRTLLDESGLGNHPEVVRFFYRAGKAIGDDNFVPSGRTAPPSGSSEARHASTLYPNQP